MSPRHNRKPDRAAERVSPIVGPGGAPIIVRQVVEAAGAAIDEDAGWSRLSGSTDRDLSPLTQSRMQRLAIYGWERNLLVNRLVELPVAYLLAEGVSVSADDPVADRAIRRFWNDPVNAMDRSLKSMVRELLLFGEACWPVFTNPANGHIRLGSIDPAHIETVVTDPDNARVVIGIVTRQDRRGRSRKFRTILNGTEGDLFTRRTQEIRAGFGDGEAYYMGLNRLTHGARGRSAVLATIDWADAYDQFLFGEIDRTAFLRAFVWDVTMTGATADQVKARAREISPPKPGSVRVHNDAEVWAAVSPDVKAYQTTESARLLRNHILGGQTVPEHWFGGAAEVNRATGQSMTEPTHKIMSSLQADIGFALADLCTLAINRAADPTGRRLVVDPYEPDEALLPQVSWPELSARDTTAYAAALGQVAVGVVAALERGLLSDLSAVQMIAAIAGRLGVEIDPAAELAQAQRDLTGRRARDSYGDDPAGVDAEVATAAAAAAAASAGELPGVAGAAGVVEDGAE